MVQNPETARVGYMPEQAIAAVAVDRIIDADDMARHINLIGNNIRFLKTKIFFKYFSNK